MTRKLVRATLLAFIGLALVVALWPSLGKIFAVEQTDLPTTHTVVLVGTCAENKYQGVTLIVEFEDQVKKLCGLNARPTGWDLLAEFGANPVGTEQYPVGFVCKLYDYPAEQDCIDTPKPNEGTWNYFYASAETEGKWVYAVTGASIRKPKCGDVEGWVFEVPETTTSASLPTTAAEPVVCK